MTAEETVAAGVSSVGQCMVSLVACWVPCLRATDSFWPLLLVTGTGSIGVV